MSTILAVSHEEIIRQAKLSGQISTILEAIATRQIVTTEAATVGIKIEPEELQQAANAFRTTNNLYRTEDTWTWLQKQGLSLDEFEERIYFTVLANKLAQHLFSEKVQPFFIEHQLDYTQIAMYEVILDDPDLAIELFYALQEGELDFYQIARQYSQNQEIRRTGGYRGLLSRSDLKPDIWAAVFAANPPQLLKPIITAQGVHVIFVEEIIQAQLDLTLRYQIISTLFTNWLQQQIKQSETTLVTSNYKV
jgi:parvulin-like peptidyl-prolyl isomerase